MPPHVPYVEWSKWYLLQYTNWYDTAGDYPGVYKIVEPIHLDVLYVGEGRLSTRLANHALEVRFSVREEYQEPKVKFAVILNKEERKRTEAELIEWHQPKFNKEEIV